MQIALTHQRYPAPRVRRQGPTLVSPRPMPANAMSQTEPGGVDVCRLVLALLGLTLYVGVPAAAVTFLASRLLT